ncbi:MAG: hypothetical protein ACREHG_00570, partial [Candidatus Saccharimonadales bacterium]
SVGDDGRFAIFKNDTEGFDALTELLQSLSYKNLTIAEAINRYSPSSENNVKSYINNICLWLHASPTDKIIQYM